MMQHIVFNGLMLERNDDVLIFFFATRKIMQDIVFTALLLDANVKKNSSPREK